jgi:hypothetical protein
MILVSACIFVGAGVSFAQNTGTTSQQQQLQQQIDQLKQLIELQNLQLQQQQAGGQTQGYIEGPMPTTPPQTQPGQLKPVGGFVEPQTPQGPVTLRPVDTGRSAVTFTIGGDTKSRNRSRNVGDGNDDNGGNGGSFGEPRFAVKTNLLYLGSSLSPNLSFEAGVGERTSVELTAGYNGWTNLWDNAGKGAGPYYDPNNNYKRRLDHLFLKGEFRYWLGERFDKHFVGANVFFADYNVGELKVPLLFDGGPIDYNGNAIGGGLTYGYLWRWSNSWAMEFSVGAGVAVMTYDKSSFIEPEGNGYNLQDTTPYRKTYFGPTSAGIKLVFTIR